MQKECLRAKYKLLLLHQANSTVNWAKTTLKKVIIRRLAKSFLLLMKTASKFENTPNIFKKWCAYHLKKAQKWKDQF